MMQNTVIYWFRQDLRLTDNPALIQACQNAQVVPIFIFDDVNAGEYQHGSASRWWLHHSLLALNTRLQQNLQIYRGDPLQIIPELCQHYQTGEVFWNRCYELWRVKRDTQLKNDLKTLNIKVHSNNGSLLWEPWQVLKSDGTPYKVFTPFYRKGCLNAEPPRSPLPEPQSPHWVKRSEKSLTIEDLSLLPNIPWYRSFEAHWSIGEQAAERQLEQFLQHGMSNYKEGRNFPAQNHVSRLAPYLHFGEISPHQIWSAVQQLAPDNNTDHFCSELGWREFSYSLLYHNPDLPVKNLQDKFDAFPWSDNAEQLKHWQQGQTGIPIVDAGMRELWQTGYMHNRVRMIVGSFLVKNLLLDWRQGERWFWDCLLDADLANNSASWQWIAGCGADAAPYFRIFNPVTQGQKFDVTGVYTRRFVPELARLPDQYLFNPWEAPKAVLQAAGVHLGQNYPEPQVDLKMSRERALAAFAQLKQTA